MIEERASAIVTVSARIATAQTPRHLRIALFALALTAASGTAQTDPSLHWRTIPTEHFRVTFSPGLEETARRAAGSAERAYAALSKELHPPRGPLTIVVADNLDVSNAYATNFPTNRIVIYARPTIDANALKFIDDWIDLVVVHELTHLFQLDRARGLWGVGQKLFGRNPFLFPHALTPSWLIEGIAVHYESKLTGAGRDFGTDFDAVTRAHDLGGRLPKLNELSGATPRFPLASLAYTFGSTLVSEMANKGKPNGMREFVDGTAAWIVPFMLNTNARRGFGFTFDSAYRAWTDSTHREAQRVNQVAPPQHSIVKGGWFSVAPRWVDNNTIEFVGTDPKSLPSLKRVSASGGPVKVVSIRNTAEANTLLPDGSRVFTQFEYSDPYTVRSELYRERNGAIHQLTRGARLTHSDARMCLSGTSASAPSGAICVVAVQLLPGAARLVHVRVSADGNKIDITQLTEPSAEELYSEPRWSHAGDRIATTHWSRGGTTSIDILDATGQIVFRSIGRSRSVSLAPAWGPGDSTIYFTNDRSGRSAIYRANVSTGAVVRIADSPTGLFESEPSPDGMRIATFQLWSDGYNLSVVDANVPGTPTDSTSVLPPSRRAPLERSDAPVQPYSSWRSVLPSYWAPVFAAAEEGRTAYGFSTGGYDIIGRHAWGLQATLEPHYNEPSLAAGYVFSGFGVPVVRLGGQQYWEHFGVFDTADARIGTLRRRRMIGDAGLIFSRTRLARSVSLSVGGSHEWRNYVADPDTLLNGLDAGFRQTLTYPSYFVSAGFRNVRRPWLALGPENGFVAGATVRQRWRNGAAEATRATSMSGTLTAYRAFDFGARIHHLLALRVAGAVTDVTSTSDFTAGGGSDGAFGLGSGLTFGDGRQAFFVRGSPSGAQRGSRAVGMTAEYRFPIALPARGFWKTPLFLQRVSGVVFSDAASAWCPSATTTSPICRTVTVRDWMASAGAELTFDTAIVYDIPIPLRFGFAVPISGSKDFSSRSGSFYAAVGLPF